MEKVEAFGSRKWVQTALKLLYYGIFASLFGMLLWKCRFGFANMDESFYLTVPYRFVRGDRMLIHEWHLSQFGFFTMIPEMWAYLHLGGTTEGIYLNFRYIYTVLWSLSSLFLYLRARTIHEYGARFASLLLMCFAPYGVMAFNYNSLGILYLTNTAIFLLCARRRQKLQFVISGVFFAGAVLCCPYLVIVYLLFSALLGIEKLRKKNPVIEITHTPAAVCWKYFTAGISLLAMLFLICLFAGTEPSRVLKGLSYALNDPEHDQFSLFYKGGLYAENLLRSNSFFLPMLLIILLMICLSLRQRRAVWFCLVCAVVWLYLRRFLQEVEYQGINYTMLPLSFGGIYVAAATKNSKTRWLAALWLLPGLFYTFCLNYSSNQQLRAITLAASVSSLASIFLMWRYCDELKEVYRQRKYGIYLSTLAFFCLTVCLLIQLRYTVSLRYQTVYWEAGLMKYEEQVEIRNGPEKGLLATSENAERYQQLYDDICRIDGKKVIFISDISWMYFLNENEMAAYSGWLSYLDERFINRMDAYCALNPEKTPDLLFVEKDNESLLSYFDSSEYILERLDSGNYLVWRQNM